MVSSKPRRGGGGGGGGPLTVFVGGIPRNLTARAVEKKFLQFGPIDSVRKPGPGNYAFIQYKNGEAARIAVDKGHTLFRGENVTVEFSHTREGAAGGRKKPPRRRSIIAKKAAALKKKAIRGRKRKVAARDRRESDKDRSPLVLIRRGQRSPSLIGGRSPDRSRRRSSISPDSRSPITKRRKRSSVGTPPDTPEEDRDRSPLRKSRSPIKSRKRSVGSPKRRWSSSLSPGPSPARSWSQSLSSAGSDSPERDSYHFSRSRSRSPSPDHLSDRSRSTTPVFKRRKKKGRPSTPSDPSPLSYRSSLSPHSKDGRSLSRSVSPLPRKGRKQWERRDSNRTLSPSPDRDISPPLKSPIGKKRKRNRGPRKNRKRGGKAASGPTRAETQVRREGGSVVKKKKRPPKGVRLKIKAREKEARLKIREVSKPVSLLDIDVKPAIRPLMDLTPIRRPPSPRERPPSPRPLMSRGRSMSMSPTPSPHRQPLEATYRRSPSPNYSYGGYRGGLYYRQQEASVVNYRGDMNSGSYKSGGYGGAYASSWDRGRLSPAPLMSSNYSMATSGSYRGRTPPRRRSPSPLMGRRYRDDRSPIRSPRRSPRDSSHRGLPSIISRSIRAGIEATKRDRERGSRDIGSRDRIVERVRDRDRDRDRDREREERRRERVRVERRRRDDTRSNKDVERDRVVERHRDERPPKARLRSRSPQPLRKVVRSRSRSPLKHHEVRGRESRSPISREERQSRRDQKLGRILGSRSPSAGDKKSKSDRRRSPVSHSSRRDRGHGSPRR